MGKRVKALQCHGRCPDLMDAGTVKFFNHSATNCISLRGGGWSHPEGRRTGPDVPTITPRPSVDFYLSARNKNC